MAVRLGGAVSLVAIAVISFDVLTDLGRRAGLHRLAELFPIAVDAFAASTMYAAYRLPGDHPARPEARRTARLALALTVSCNVLDHFLQLAGFLIPAVLRDLLLVAVASLPQLVADRELHLLTAVTAHWVRDKSADDQFERRSSRNVAAAAPPAPDLTSVNADALTVRDVAWLEVAAPVYRELLNVRGRRPTEKAFHAALAERLAAQTVNLDVLSGQPVQEVTAVGGLSLSTAKRVRALVEEHRSGARADPEST